MPPASLARLNAALMPSFIWLPSSLAAPLNGAEIPNRISLSVTPRMVGPLALGASILATRAGATLVGCGAADAIGRPSDGAPLVGCGDADVGRPAAGSAALVGCGAAEAIGRPVGGAAIVGREAVDAIERPGVGELTCVDVFGVSSLDVASVVFAPTPDALRHVVPATKYTPIAAPNTTAKKTETSHEGLQREGGKRMISGSSDRRRIVASLSEGGRKPALGISFSAPGLPC